MKRINIFTLIVLGILLSPIATASGTREEQEIAEAAIYTNMVGQGIEEIVVIIKDDDVIVDYVVPELNHDTDLLLQVQGIFTLAAKYVPESTMTIVKVRYDSDEESIIVAAVPTQFTVMMLDGLLDVESFFGMMDINSPDLIKAVMTAEQQEKNLGMWFLIFLIFLFAVFLTYCFRDKIKFVYKKNIQKGKQISSKIHKSKKKHLRHQHKTSLKRKIIALVLNLFIPGAGYFLFGKIKRKKAIILTIMSVPSLISSAGIFVMLRIVVFIYALIDVSIMIWKKK